MMAYPQTEVTMKTVIEKSAAEIPALKSATAKAPDIASASVPDTLTVLQVNPDTGLTHAEVDIRRKERGCRASAKRKVPGVGTWQIA